MSDPQTNPSLSGRRKRRGGRMSLSAPVRCTLLYVLLTVLIAGIFVVSLIPRKYNLLIGQVPTVGGGR